MLSLIIPVFNEEEVLKLSHARMIKAMESTGCDFEIIYINDGSRDGSMAILRELASSDAKVKVLSFSRNFGHQLAVTAGMDAAKGSALVVIDVDLQDPPELIPKMVEMWRNGADIVYGKREKRSGESIFKRLSAFCYYRLLGAMSTYPIPLDTGDFRLLDRKVADVFLEMREHNRFLRGMSAWMGFSNVPLEFKRESRAAGETKYTLKKMLKLAFDGIAGFSYKPLTIPGYIGAFLSGMSLLGFIALITLSLTVGVSPWLYGLCFVVLLQGITLIALGLQGAYMGRMYDELKGRPLYIVAEHLNKDIK